MRKMKMCVARLLVLSLALGMAPAGGKTEARAAKKPTLSNKKVTITKGKTKKITVKNAKKYKVSWKVKDKKIATVKKSGTYGVKITAKKAGKTTLTCTLKKNKKKLPLTCTIIVNPKNSVTTPPVANTAAATANATATPSAGTSAKPTATPEVPSFKETYAGLIDNIGTSITYNQPWGSNGKQLQDKDMMEIVDRHYNSITLENEMKPSEVLGAAANLVSKEKAKEMGYYLEGYEEETVPVLNLKNVFGAMEEAKKHNLRMRAHTLLWHQQTPDWFFKEGYSPSGKVVSKETMDARLEFFVRTMVQQVSAKEKELTGEVGSIVYCWDVVNEYLHRENAPTSASWVDVYGDMELRPSYVKNAFRYAYDELKKLGVQDKVVLFSNDYDTYFSVEDEIALVNFINEGEPEKICRGMGMQTHVDIRRPTVAEYKAALEAFLNTGLEVQITEMDITINFDTDETDDRTPTYKYVNEGETKEDQAVFTKEFMKAVVEAHKNRNTTVNPKGITGITVWGIYDGISWRSECEPLFFARSYYTDPQTGKKKAGILPKPSYYEILNAVRER